MFRPRIIPVLLLQNQGLVKTTRFADARYIGDPINAVKIFNDLKADELVFLDIRASQEKRCISIDFLKEIAEEANMPFSAGGGISTLDEIRKIIGAGAEKVVLNTVAGTNPEFVREAASEFGSSTIVVCIDVKKKLLKGQQTWTHNASQSTGYSPVDFARLMEEMGAGEIIVQSVDRDGTMKGYDTDLIFSVSKAVSVPVVALGGAGSLNDMKMARKEGCASGLAAGSMFVYYGANKGILINYPDRSEILQTLRGL